MIELFYWPTPNGHKITLFLEEAGVDYRLSSINLGAGEQLRPAFLAISPNNRIPAIIDHAPADGGEPVSLFESGAILFYLAEKFGKFLPTERRERSAVMAWLFWQVGGLGPMAGQNQHFSRFAPEKLPYAIERYVKETNRLYGVLDRRLADHPFLGGSLYSIADMASYPWIVPWEMQGQDLADFPHLRRWFEGIRERPATLRAYARGEGLRTQNAMSEEARRILFGQTAASVAPR